MTPLSSKSTVKICQIWMRSMTILKLSFASSNKTIAAILYNEIRNIPPRQGVMMIAMTLPGLLVNVLN